MAIKNFYRTLGIPNFSSEEEVKKAFRQLAVKLHPDKNPGNALAEEQFKELNEAYEILRDPPKKAKHDSLLQRHLENENRNPLGSTEKSNEKSIVPTDLKYHLSISLEEARHGCERLISFVRKRGGRDEETRIQVKVPAGVVNHQKLKLKREGDGSHGRYGDLFVILEIKRHPFFKVEGGDLLLELPVTFKQAALGFEAKIPTLDGFSLVEIPAGTQSGTVLRLKNKGVGAPSGTKTGDLLVTIKVETPQNLSSEQVKVLNHFDDLEKNYKITKDFYHQMEKHKSGKKER